MATPRDAIMVVASARTLCFALLWYRNTHYNHGPLPLSMVPCRPPESEITEQLTPFLIPSLGIVVMLLKWNPEGQFIKMAIGRDCISELAWPKLNAVELKKGHPLSYSMLAEQNVVSLWDVIFVGCYAIFPVQSGGKQTLGVCPPQVLLVFLAHNA